MNETIIISAHLSGPANRRKVDYLDRLQAYLRQFGFRLLLLNLDGHDIDTDCDYTTLPRLASSDTKPHQGLSGSVEMTSELARAAGVEAGFRDTDFVFAASTILRAAQTAQQLILAEKPCLFVLWSQFTGVHRATAAVCKAMGVAHVFAHLGILPGTINFEGGGQMAESWVARQNEGFLELPVDQHDLDVACRYLEYVRRRKATRKPQTTDWSIRDTSERIRRQRRRIIFYAGQHDYHSGMWPSWLPNAREHSPFFVHTLDALQYLARLAEANNWQVLYKPHPNIEERQSQYESFCHEHIELVKGANVFECMSESDLTVTILSQASYLALIHKRPVLLLGRNQLSGKRCLYEVTSVHEVGSVIQEALREGFTAAQQDNWLRHVAQVCSHYVFSFDPDVREIIGRDVDEAARYLMLHCRFPVSLYAQHMNPMVFTSQDELRRQLVDDHEDGSGATEKGSRAMRWTLSIWSRLPRAVRDPLKQLARTASRASSLGESRAQFTRPDPGISEPAQSGD